MRHVVAITLAPKEKIIDQLDDSGKRSGYLIQTTMTNVAISPIYGIMNKN